MILFKVLNVNGKSCHGGNFKYSLPVKTEAGEWTPGKWHEVKGDLEMCGVGFHLTTSPLRWIAKQARLFVAEYSGAFVLGRDDKSCFRKVRLVREVMPTDTIFSPTLRAFFAIANHSKENKAYLSGANLSGAYRSSSDAPIPGWELRNGELYEIKGC